MSIFRWVAARIILVLAFAGAYWLTGMALDRQPPIRYLSAKALQREVPQGGSIDIGFKVFRERICPLEVKRWLTDSKGQHHSIPSYTTGLKLLAGMEAYQRSITIPTAAATGPAYYQVTLLFTCNLFQRLGWPIEVVSPRIKFDITPGVVVVPAPEGDG